VKAQVCGTTRGGDSSRKKEIEKTHRVFSVRRAFRPQQGVERSRGRERRRNLDETRIDLDRFVIDLDQTGIDLEESPIDSSEALNRLER